MRKSVALPLLVLAGVLVVISFFIVKPFLTGLLSGIILIYLFYPLYNVLKNKTRSPRTSAILTTAIAVLLISGILVLVLNTAAREGQELYTRTQGFLSSNVFNCQSDTCIIELLGRPEVQEGIQEGINGAIVWLNNRISAFLFAVPAAILNLIVAVFTMFYLFRDGPELYKRIIHALPVEQSHRTRIAHQLGEVTFATMYGSILVAIIQGLLGGIGFWLLGLPSPVVTALIISVIAVIPLLGAWIVWLPVAFITIIEGLSTADNSLLIKGIVLLVYGTVIISGVDNILKPKLIGERAGVHPVLIMIGGLGGLLLFGPLGFVIGPVILALLKTGFEIYEQEAVN